MRISRILSLLFALVLILSTVMTPVLAASSQAGIVEESATIDHLEALVNDKVLSEIVLAPKKSLEFQVYAVSKNGDKEDKVDITKDKETKYKSDKTSLVTVDQGKVSTTSKSGDTKITVTYKNLKLEIPVTVSKTAIVSLDPAPTVFVNVSKTQKVTVKAKQADSKSVDVTKSVEWAIDKEDIATVTKGEVKGIAEGTATITASYKGKSVNITVQVLSDKKISKLTSSKTKFTVKTSQEVEVKITAEFADNSKEDVTSKVYWKADKPTIADVVDGKLVGLKAGETKVTAKYGDKEVKVTVKVESTELINRKSLVAKEVALLPGMSIYQVTGTVTKGSKVTADFNGKLTTVEVDKDGKFKFNSSGKSGIKDFTLTAEKDGVKDTYKGTFSK